MKMLIVLIVLLLSVGPVEYFLMGGQKTGELELPEDNTSEQPLMHTLAPVNLSGTIIEMQPYISYVGVTDKNDKSYVDGVLRKIGLTNYSLEVSLNPNGDGYQYSIVVPAEYPETKYVGFRMSYRLAGFFDSKRSMPPVVIGKVRIAPVTFLKAANEAVNLTADNVTAQAVLLYSDEPNSTVQLVCPEAVASLNWKLTRITKACLDATQPYAYGLQLIDMFTTEEKKAQLNAFVQEIKQAELSGSFAYGNSVTKASLEGAANRIPGVPYAEAAVTAPQNRLTLVGVNKTLNITGGTAQASGNDTVIAFNTSLQSVLDQVKGQLGYMPETSLPNGTFSLKFNFTESGAPAGVKASVEALGLGVAVSSKTATIDLPSAITAENETYDLLYTKQIPVKLDYGALPGAIPINITLNVKFGEVLSVSGQEA